MMGGGFVLTTALPHTAQLGTVAATHLNWSPEVSEVYSANKRPRAVPLHRVAVLRPFVSYLEQHGAPVRREFRRVRLPYAALEDPDNYVPSERFRSFVVSSAQREGIETLGFEVGLAYGANCADPHMRQRLLRSPTLR